MVSIKSGLDKIIFHATCFCTKHLHTTVYKAQGKAHPHASASGFCVRQHRSEEAHMNAFSTGICMQQHVHFERELTWKFAHDSDSNRKAIP